MSILRFLDKYFEISISVFLLLFMTALIAIQVFMRYVMGEPLSWSEELARYVFIWLIYLMISYSAREMKHIKIDAALDCAGDPFVDDLCRARCRLFPGLHQTGPDHCLASSQS